LTVKDTVLIFFPAYRQAAMSLPAEPDLKNAAFHRILLVQEFWKQSHPVPASPWGNECLTNGRALGSMNF
jgi:hypothetical protein